MKTKVVQPIAKNKTRAVIAPIMEQLPQILPSKDAAKEMGEYFYQNIPVKHFIEWIGVSLESLVSCEQTKSDKHETMMNLILIITQHLPDMLECKNSVEFEKPVVNLLDSIFADYSYAKKNFIITCTTFLDCHNKANHDESTLIEYLVVNAHLLVLCEMYDNYKYLRNEESTIKKQAA